MLLVENIPYLGVFYVVLWRERVLFHRADKPTQVRLRVLLHIFSVIHTTLAFVWVLYSAEVETKFSYHKKEALTVQSSCTIFSYNSISFILQKKLGQLLSRSPIQRGV